MEMCGSSLSCRGTLVSSGESGPDTESILCLRHLCTQPLSCGPGRADSDVVPPSQSIPAGHSPLTLLQEPLHRCVWVPTASSTPTLLSRERFGLRDPSVERRLSRRSVFPHVGEPTNHHLLLLSRSSVPRIPSFYHRSSVFFCVLPKQVNSLTWWDIAVVSRDKKQETAVTRFFSTVSRDRPRRRTVCLTTRLSTFLSYTEPPHTPLLPP